MDLSCPETIALSAGLWEQSDAVKALHSKLLLSDVLADRAKQMLCAQQELARMREEEALYAAQERADLEVLLPFFRILDSKACRIAGRQKNPHGGRGS